MSNKNKALFMDIDGTVVEDTGYVSKPKDLKLLPGVSQSLRKAQENGYLLVFHSNKGGAFEKKGLNGDGLKKLDVEFKRKLAETGVDIANVFTYYCPHYLDEKNQSFCTCRKPKTRLFDRAIKELNIDPKMSFGIGDKISDLLPALAVLVKRVVLVKRNGEYFDIKESGEKVPYEKCNNLSEAVNFILEKDNGYFF